jgi:hypothetical protein
MACRRGLSTGFGLFAFSLDRVEIRDQKVDRGMKTGNPKKLLFELHPRIEMQSMKGDQKQELVIGT